MKRYLIAAAMLALVAPASAQTPTPTPAPKQTAAPSPRQAPVFVTKAPVAPVGYPYNTSGWYFGLGASAEGGSASLANTGVISNGAGVMVSAGYQWLGGLDFLALQIDATYQNLGTSSTCNPAAPAPCSMNEKWEIEPGVKIGFPITWVESLLPNINSIFSALPVAVSTPGLNVATQHPYVYFGAPVRDVSANYGLQNGKVWDVQAAFGVGILSQFTGSSAPAGVVWDTRAEMSFGSSGINLSAVPGVPTGHVTQNAYFGARTSILF